MSRCTNCEFANHDQFQNHPGRWLCLHPYRNEISNRGTFTFPAVGNPNILICETPTADYNNPSAHTKALAAAKTPVWCYIEVVERAKKEQPTFDPDKQRAILWPQKAQRKERMLWKMKN